MGRFFQIQYMADIAAPVHIWTHMAHGLQFNVLIVGDKLAVTAYCHSLSSGYGGI